MDKNRVKITREYPEGSWEMVETGYMDEDGEFVYHSFDDKPAIIYNYGAKEWCKDGNRHRDGDLPAFERLDGYKSWWKEAEHHREGGKPAVIREDGSVEYWLEGKQYYPDQKLPEYTSDQLKEKVGHDFKLIIEVK